MKIKSVRLINGYKRFHNLTIDLGSEPKRIVALVGSNGCGKSSVFDGFLYLNHAHAAIGNKGGKDKNYHAMSIEAPNFDHSNVIVEFEEGNFNTVFSKKNMEGKGNTIFSFRSPYRYNNILKITSSQSIPELKLNNYGASTSSDLDEKMEFNYRRLNIKYYNFLNEQDCKPSEAKIKIIDELNNSISKCLDLKISNLGNIDDNKGTLFFTKSDHSKEIDFNVLSSGEKEVVDLLLDLYLRKDEFNDTIFLIDEPELHLNTSIQRKLLIEINKLVGENCQMWVATHSIGFLRALQDELKNECQVIYFPKGVEWASTEQKLFPIKKSISKWKEIFETALDDLSGLLSPKTIVYCEGKDQPGTSGQERGFDAKVYNNIFSEKYHDTLFVSSGGNTELDQRSEIAISILSKILSEIKILVLKDRDISSGIMTTEEDRQRYLLNNPNYHRVLKRVEIENYLFDKEVLKAYCLEYSLAFDEIEYDKYFTDIINQNVKDEVSRIKNYCGIKTSLNPEIFKLNLSKVVRESMDVYKELEHCIF